MLFAAAASALALAAMPAAAAEWYFGGALGVTLGGGADATIDDGVDIISGELDYDTGALLSLSAGTTVKPNVRVEGEMLITDNGLSDTDLRMQHVGILGNVFYDFKTAGKFTPYAGAGVGFGRAIVELDDASANDTGLAWQLRVGATVRQSETLVWDIGYRYLNQADFNASEDGVSVDLAGDVHAIHVGLRFGG